jgi:Na+(H+)/acetate symporter ActP
VRVALAVLLLVLGVPLTGFGAWLIAKSRLPTWMRGIWKWPLGDNLSLEVVRMVGWASVLAGSACPPMIVLLILWNRGTTAWIASIVAMLFAGAAAFATIWSVRLSRTNPAKLN